MTSHCCVNPSVLRSTLAVLLLLAGCSTVRTGGTPKALWYHYKGRLSERCPATVIEAYVYSTAPFMPFYALMDIDNDGILDLYIWFDDRGVGLDRIGAMGVCMAHHVRGTHSHCLYGSERPEVLRQSSLLEDVYLAAHRKPTPATLKALLDPASDRTERWLAAVESRNGGDSQARICDAAYRNLIDGRHTLQCAFVLSGYGGGGIRMLGKALRTAGNSRAARDAAICLASAGASAVVPDLVVALDRDWQNTRACVLLALLTAAQVSPDAVAPYLDDIIAHAVDEDGDMPYAAQLIREAVERHLRRSGVSATPNQSLQRDGCPSPACRSDSHYTPYPLWYCP